MNWNGELKLQSRFIIAPCVFGPIVATNIKSDCTFAQESSFTHSLLLLPLEDYATHQVEDRYMTGIEYCFARYYGP